MPPHGTAYEKYVKLQERSTQAVLFAFELDSIYKACKIENVTVNDILVAASLLALRKSQSSQINKDSCLETSLLTCVNLRNPKLGLADKINANHLACLFNIIVQPQKIESTSTIRNLSETYHQLSTLFIKQLAHPPKNFSIKEMYKRYGLNSATTRHHFSGGIATSNLGKIDLKKKYGDISIVFYQFFTNQCAGFFEVLLDVTCVENTVYCNATYVEPLHSRQWAVQFVLDFIHEINLFLEDRLILIENSTDKEVLDHFIP